MLPTVGADVPACRRESPGSAGGHLLQDREADKVCNSAALLQAAYGHENARCIQHRLFVLQSMPTLAEVPKLPPDCCHALKGSLFWTTLWTHSTRSASCSPRSRRRALAPPPRASVSSRRSRSTTSSTTTDGPNLRYTPDYIVSPGSVLEEYLTELGMSKAESAQRCGRPNKTISDILRRQGRDHPRDGAPA